MRDDVTLVVVGPAPVDPPPIERARKWWVLPQRLVLDGHHVGVRHEQQPLPATAAHPRNEVPPPWRRLQHVRANALPTQHVANKRARGCLASRIRPRPIVNGRY